MSDVIINMATYYDYLLIETAYPSLIPQIVVNSNYSGVLNLDPFHPFGGLDILPEEEPTTSNARIANSADFHYLGTFNSSGKPDYLEPTRDVLSQDFLNGVNAALPERQSVLQSKPQYIAKTNKTDLVITQTADVWVTFVHEGAGWRNALGFYTYPTALPPESKDDIDSLKVIFPNVSMTGSGGQLVPGDKVWLGKFEPGTSIGWFLVANGFSGGQLGNGNYIHYSKPDFNLETDPDKRAHMVVFDDDETDEFQDVPPNIKLCQM